MTSVSMTTVTDPSPVNNTESAGVEDAESSQGGKPAQPEPGKDLTAEEEALLKPPKLAQERHAAPGPTGQDMGELIRPLHKRNRSHGSEVNAVVGSRQQS